MKAGGYMKTIVRKKYLDRIIELNGTPDIKIITGIRRSGKSKLMQAYMEHLKTNCENINIIFIDFMDLEFEEIKEYHALHSYVEQHYAEGKTNYLFIDEVQMCPKFELAINSLYSKGKYDIYMTGSNAFLLSADLATLFTNTANTTIMSPTRISSLMNTLSKVVWLALMPIQTTEIESPISRKYMKPLLQEIWCRNTLYLIQPFCKD